MIQAELIDRTDDAVLNEGTAVVTVEKARALVELFAKVTTSRDPDAFVSGFTEDCVVRFNCSPEVHGRKALRDFMASRFARLNDSFKCVKTLRCISGNVLGVAWVGTWVDPQTHQTLTGRGSEFWIMRGDQIARWDATYGQ